MGFHARTQKGAVLLAICTLWGGTVARADVINFHADMSTAANVPVITDSSGSGTVDASYDTATKQLSYTVTYSGLTGPATAAHFHGPADPTTNAGIQVTVLGSLASPISGTATLSDSQAADLEAGKWYVQRPYREVLKRRNSRDGAQEVEPARAG